MIRPGQFKYAFMYAYSLISEEVTTAFRAEDLAHFTEVMLNEGNGLLKQVTNILHLDYHTQVKRIDAVLFDNGIPAVAIEHENDCKTSMEEVAKLAQLDVPLRVLVTYPNGGDFKRWMLLQEYAQAIDKAGGMSDFMVVYGRERRRTLAWEFYVYNDGMFDDLPY